VETDHRLFFTDSKEMGAVSSESIDLVVTSPPYPMIAMWDETFALMNPAVKKALDQEDGIRAFDLMHAELDRVWDEVGRVLKQGGLVCVNIGDATRTVGRDFRLYPNHSRLLNKFLKLKLNVLPAILWRKQTNAPNKFMGSGTLPAGAYVTLEHEYILILRKGSKREFTSEAAKRARRESAVFWEERNVWYSDVWMDLKGTTQKMNNGQTRSRSGAFPFDLAYRLINMHSVKEDMVLDPFLGTGTTTAAAMASGRNSAGFEIDPAFKDAVFERVALVKGLANEYVSQRLENHQEFVRSRTGNGGSFKHKNKHYGFPVITKPETELVLDRLVSVSQIDNGFRAVYSTDPEQRFTRHDQKIFDFPS
jgi:DNA modification methylase